MVLLMIKNKISNSLNKVKEKRSVQKKNRVSFYPKFKTGEEIADQFYRACWYLPKLDGKCDEVYLNVKKGIQCGVKPDHMASPVTSREHISLNSFS